MFRKIALTAVSVLALGTGAALAAGKGNNVPDVEFAHEGLFGKFDQFQLQRGLQVFTEVCSACHGMKQVPIRALAEPGGPELPADQVRAYAAGLSGVLLPTGDERPREWTDKFPAGGMETAPDLSLMAKARAGFTGPYGTGMNQLFRGMGGAEYIHALLVGYVDTPECAAEFETDLYYNENFQNGAVPESCKDEHGHSKIKGSWISMPPPLSDDLVTYADGTAATLDQLSMDVSAFLMWAAEPQLVARKQASFVAVTFLIILSVLLYLTNKRLWSRVKGKEVQA